MGLCNTGLCELGLCHIGLLYMFILTINYMYCVVEKK